MPYISQERRREIGFRVKDNGPVKDRRLVSFYEPMNTGEMNYVISKLLYETFPVGDYEGYNAVIGLLECIKQEYYRRFIAQYEEQKKFEHGDFND